MQRIDPRCISSQLHFYHVLILGRISDTHQNRYDERHGTFQREAEMLDAQKSLNQVSDNSTL